MDLSHEFRVPLPVHEAWAVLTNIERIAPCMPGAALEGVDGDEYRGTVKVKVGPMTAQYRGTVRFLERDNALYRAVLRAEGRETRGQGNAAATITATVTPDGDGSTVRAVTDLTISGKVAQFGRGVLADVSTRLMGQFVDCLEKDLAASMEPSIPATAVEPVDLVATAGAPVAKRAAPLVAVVFLAYWLLRRRRKKRKK
ncbi:MAG: carbon monoxide dehydrogenase [Actinobacteria bacterium]|nr:MAG: carbon monoxide dehydrogenase [Actinomycetota bacterium]